jgi:hypothetical protein
MKKGVRDPDPDPDPLVKGTDPDPHINVMLLHAIVLCSETGEEQAGRSDVRDQADPPQPRGQDAQQEDHAGGEAPLQAQS